MRTPSLSRVQRLVEIGKEQNLDWILGTLSKNIFYFFFRASAHWARNVGHGLALTIRESPWIAGKDKTVMNEDMVVTIESFLMCPPFGAFTHCDVVQVTARG